MLCRSYDDETPEEHQERLRKIRGDRHKKLLEMNPQILAQKRKDMAERARLKRLQETPEEAERRKKRIREAAAIRRAFNGM